MKSTRLDVTPSPPAMPHRIRGMRHADAPVSSIDIQMHRYVVLEAWSLRAAANAFWRLYWPTSRGARVMFQGTEHALDPSFLYLISPHTAFDSECSRPFGKWYLHFNVGGLLETCRPGIVRIRPTARMRALLLRTCPGPTRSRKAAPTAIDPLESLELALLALQRALPQFRLSTTADSRLPQCIAYLGARLTQKVTLAELARFSGFSARTLSHRFVAELGLPPMRYLIELRLNHAMKLLRHTDHTIEQIAEECGFPNRYYFTRMLAKYRKTTPAAFREQAQRSTGWSETHDSPARQNHFEQ